MDQKPLATSLTSPLCLTYMNTINSIVILTGAGISAESGIKTFRAADGLWEEHRIEDVASPQGYARDPALVHRFYNARRRQLLSDDIAPNPAHEALARLEAEFAGEVLLVTQNIDNLHERAGSKNIVHMHGELLKARCEACGDIQPISAELDETSVCVACGQVGEVRPHIVWFGEMPMAMDKIYTALAGSDLFIAIGTSGHVYPAAGFVEAANAGGAHTVEINLDPSAVESHFDAHIYGQASVEVNRFVDNLLND